MGGGGGGLGGGNFCDEVAAGGEAGGEVWEGEEFCDEVGVGGVFCVGWVGEDEIVGGGVALEEMEGFGSDGVASFEVGFFEVFLGDGDGAAVFVDKGAGGGSAAEGF